MESLIHLITASFFALFAAFPMHTSLVSYSAPALRPPERMASILFAGDMMFDRTVRKAIDEQGGDHIFSCIDTELQRHDLVIANLEGPITSHASVSATSTPGGPNNFTFTFATSTAKLLFDHNIRLVNIGNNHIMNFSRQGLFETKKYLNAAYVQYFGDPDSDEDKRVARMDIQGIPVSFVNWSDWTSDNTDHTVAQVRKEVEAGRIVFVYTHWGEEYVEPLPRVRALAHSFIDAGATMVIGSHPHIVQEHEIYKGKDIYYSLGNFIFDQYWNEQVSRGLMLEVDFTQNGVQFVREIPVQLQRDRRTCEI